MRPCWANLAFTGPRDLHPHPLGYMSHEEPSPAQQTDSDWPACEPGGRGPCDALPSSYAGLPRRQDSKLQPSPPNGSNPLLRIRPMIGQPGNPGWLRRPGASIERSRALMEPSPRSRPTNLDSQGAHCTDITGAARPGLEPGVSCFMGGRGAAPPPRIGLNGEVQTPNPRLPTPVRFQLRYVQVSA